MKRSMSVSLLSLFFLFAAGCAEEEALCPDGESSCDGTCVDTMHDPLHCGGCGIACAAGEFCIEGVCGCPDGEPSCAPENPDLFGLCFQAGQMVPLSKEHGLRVGTPLSGMEGPQTMARLDEDHVVVVGSMDQTLRVVDRRTMRIVGAHTFAAEAGPTMPNHVIVDGDRAYVTLSGTNEVAVVDLQERADPRVAYTVSTGEGTNPYFVAKADDTLYVSLWIANAVLPIRVGHDSGEAKSAIPIEGEIEGLAYPAGVAVAGGRVYAALNNLDDNFAPAGNGRLWSYDPASDAQEFVDLGPDCKNPGYVATRGETVYLACAGKYGADDGAIAVYDPASEAGVRVIHVGGAPARLSLDGEVIYAADAAGTKVLRVTTDGSVETIDVCSETEWEFVADVLVLP